MRRIGLTRRRASQATVIKSQLSPDDESQQPFIAGLPSEAATVLVSKKSSQEPHLSNQHFDAAQSQSLLVESLQVESSDKSDNIQWTLKLGDHIAHSAPPIMENDLGLINEKQPVKSNEAPELHNEDLAPESMISETDGSTHQPDVEMKAYTTTPSSDILEEYQMESTECSAPDDASFPTPPDSDSERVMSSGDMLKDTFTQPAASGSSPAFKRLTTHIVPSLEMPQISRVELISPTRHAELLASSKSLVPRSKAYISPIKWNNNTTPTKKSHIARSDSSDSDFGKDIEPIPGPLDTLTGIFKVPRRDFAFNPNINSGSPSKSTFVHSVITSADSLAGSSSRIQNVVVSGHSKASSSPNDESSSSKLVDAERKTADLNEATYINEPTFLNEPTLLNDSPFLTGSIHCNDSHISYEPTFLNEPTQQSPSNSISSSGRPRSPVLLKASSISISPAREFYSSDTELDPEPSPPIPIGHDPVRGFGNLPRSNTSSVPAGPDRLFSDDTSIPTQPSFINYEATQLAVNVTSDPSSRSLPSRQRFIVSTRSGGKKRKTPTTDSVITNSKLPQEVLHNGCEEKCIGSYQAGPSPEIHLEGTQTLNLEGAPFLNIPPVISPIRNNIASQGSASSPISVDCHAESSCSTVSVLSKSPVTDNHWKGKGRMRSTSSPLSVPYQQSDTATLRLTVSALDRKRPTRNKRKLLSPSPVLSTSDSSSAPNDKDDFSYRPLRSKSKTRPAGKGPMVKKIKGAPVPAITIPPSPNTSMKPDSLRVLALWAETNKYYAGTVIAHTTKGCRVKFDDRTFAWVPLDQIRLLRLTIGEPVREGTLSVNSYNVAREFDGEGDNVDVVDAQGRHRRIRTSKLVVLPEDIAQRFDDRVVPASLVDFPIIGGIHTSISSHTSQLEGKIFLITGTDDGITPEALRRLIEGHGGQVEADWERFFTITPSGYELNSSVTPFVLQLGTRCVMTAKVMAALATGIPILASRYVHDAIDHQADWRAYIISPGESHYLGQNASQMIDPKWGEIGWKLKDARAVRQPLLGRVVLYVEPSARFSRREDLKILVPFCLGALGADVHRVLRLPPDLDPYDLVMVEDRDRGLTLSKTHQGSGKLCNVAWLKSCLVLGKALPPSLRADGG